MLRMNIFPIVDPPAPYCKKFQLSVDLGRDEGRKQVRAGIHQLWSQREAVGSRKPELRWNVFISLRLVYSSLSKLVCVGLCGKVSQEGHSGIQ